MVIKVDIWSDIRCPFCFIGKRNFEMARDAFPHRKEVEVVWHSFQLDPGLVTTPGVHAFDYLARVKGITREDAVRMHDHVQQAGEEAGVEFNFEKVVVANSLKAHRLIQMAKAKGLADAAEEALFHAHFSQGKNIDDRYTLEEIGAQAGLSAADVAIALERDEWASQVAADEALARSIGIRGVPFFIFNEKFAVSGAQPKEAFLQALNRAWSDAQTLQHVVSSPPGKK